jgi:hypothetical protein
MAQIESALTQKEDFALFLESSHIIFDLLVYLVGALFRDHLFLWWSAVPHDSGNSGLEYVQGYRPVGFEPIEQSYSILQRVCSKVRGMARSEWRGEKDGVMYEALDDQHGGYKCCARPAASGEEMFENKAWTGLVVVDGLVESGWRQRREQGRLHRRWPQWHFCHMSQHRM